MVAIMLSDTLFRVPRAEGLQLLQRRGAGGARELTTWRLCLGAGQSHRYVSDDEETIVVLQQGQGDVDLPGHRWSVARSSVFDSRATAIYVPPGVVVTVTAATPLEGVLISTPARSGPAPAIATPADVVVNQRGRANYAREVHDIFVRDTHVQRLMVGETFNPPGNWSSYPPHKHDGRDGEPALEEVYYFRIDPPQGFGHQVLYTADGEAVTHQVRDGDAVLLPYGYHPVSSAPGYRLYYLWAMAGEQRKLALYEDPAHRWIHEAEF
jgi:5-deoxy-glucuronate isomerase